MKRTLILTAMLIILLCYYSASTPSHLIAADLSDDNMALVIGVPLVQTNKGLQMIEAAPFIDEANRTQVPLRIIAEQLGADVQFAAPNITLSLNAREISMEVGQAQAVIDGQSIILDSAPRIVQNRTFVPLRFLAEALGFTTFYEDGTVLVAADNVSSAPMEDLSLYLQEFEGRWLSVDPSWAKQEIQVTPSSYSDSYRFFWLPQEDGSFWLCQSSLSDLDHAFVIVRDFLFDSMQNNQVMTYAFRVYPDACYAILHTGFVTMGNEYLYRFSSDGAILLLRDRLSSHLELAGDYIYYLESAFREMGTIKRIHVPTALSNEGPDVDLSERIGQPDFSYGYFYQKGGGPLGFCIDGDFLYANGFQTDARSIDMALYRVDLQTMEHVELLDHVAMFPQIYHDQIIFLSVDASRYINPPLHAPLYRAQLDGSQCELLVEQVQGFYCQGNDIVYWNEYNEEGQPLLQRYPLS